MDNKQVEIFLTVADTLSFSEAAFQLSYAPSVVTKHIQNLEKELNVVLFERNARSKVSLTHAGSELLPFFKNLRYDFKQLNQKASDLTQSETGNLTFACPTPLGTLRDETLLSRFWAEHPEIIVHHHSMDIPDILHGMENYKIDVGMGVIMSNDDLNDAFKTVSYRDDLEFVSVQPLEMFMCLSEKHRLASKENINLSDLKDETFVFKAEGGEMMEGNRISYFREMCRREGFDPKIKLLYGMRNKTICEVMYANDFIFPAWNNIDFFFRGAGIISKRLPINYMPASTKLFYRKSNMSAELKLFIKSCKKTIENEKLNRMDYTGVFVK